VWCNEETFQSWKTSKLDEMMFYLNLHDFKKKGIEDLNDIYDTFAKSYVVKHYETPLGW